MGKKLHNLYGPVKDMPTLLVSDGVRRVWERNKDARALIIHIAFFHQDPQIVRGQFDLKDIQLWKLKKKDEVGAILEGVFQGSGDFCIIPVPGKFSHSPKFEVFCRSLDVSGQDCQVFFTGSECSPPRNKGFG